MDLKSFALGVLSFKEALVQLPVENDKRFETLVHSMAVIKAAKDGIQPTSSVLNAGLDALASFLFSPTTTLAIVRHFMPLIPELVERKLANNVSNIWSLMEREDVALATSILLPLAPHIVERVLVYFRSSPSIFERFLQSKKAVKEQIDLWDGNEDDAPPPLLLGLLKICRASYYLLTFDPCKFKTLWDWGPLFYYATFSKHCFGWYAARSVAVVMSFSYVRRRQYWASLGYTEATFAAISPPGDADGADASSVRIDLSISQNLGGLILPPSVDENSSTRLGLLQEVLPGVAINEKLFKVCSLLLPRRARVPDKHLKSISNSHSSDIVYTPTTTQSIKNIAAALCQTQPLLLVGPSGCGKTSLLREIARMAGQEGMIELHLDSQIDSKTLVGTYVCTDVPGEFRWQSGALTQAVQQGLWVVIEDIDRAPFEVLTSLVPLLETRKILLPGRGDVVDAAPGFRLFGTYSAANINALQLCGGKGEILRTLWQKIEIPSPNISEVEAILIAKYPETPEDFLKRVMGTYSLLTGQGGDRSDPGWNRRLRRFISLRDLLRWTRRSITQYFIQGRSKLLKESERLDIVSEAIDLFCSPIKSWEHRLQLAKLIGVEWGIADSAIENRGFYKPQWRSNLGDLLLVGKEELSIGRMTLSILNANVAKRKTGSNAHSFAMTGQALRLLEQLAACIVHVEPILLVGETGCGKTTVIQHLADHLGQKLRVQNLNIQTESSELLGGYKPVEIRQIALPLYGEFCILFENTFDIEKNFKVLDFMKRAIDGQDWKKMIYGFKRAIKRSAEIFKETLEHETDTSRTGKPSTATECENNAVGKLLSGKRGRSDAAKSDDRILKRKKMVKSNSVKIQWAEFSNKVRQFSKQLKQVENSFAFAFVEGALVKALRSGEWILLDEINLASPDTLQRLCSILDNAEGTLSLTEKGEVKLVPRHPNFRIFAAMNPATDVGKRDLSPSLRHRFTEIYVDELRNRNDLMLVCQKYLSEVKNAPISNLVDFYLDAREWSKKLLVDGAGQAPHYSLRTLCRALQASCQFVERGYKLERAIYEGLSMSFVTQLELKSMNKMLKAIRKGFCQSMRDKDFIHPPPRPRDASSIEWVMCQSFWIPKGPLDCIDWATSVDGRQEFVITKSVQENLGRLARCLSGERYPILLQGPTSSGKTTLVSYLAALTGHKCVRINNHEHTDLQEYMGSYISSPSGKLVFKEGLLVQAARHGWWIILDELNLAPSEVLEALNRLLDDNRELLIPETQEFVTPHREFMLFATQNPPGQYAGRKVLSRAFRNRFLELHIDDLPNKELNMILHKRCGLQPKFCDLMIDIMTELQQVRQQSQIFAGKHGFITTRDLLRWGNRKSLDTKSELAEQGYMLLGERIRRPHERNIVKKILEKHCGVTIDVDRMYESRFSFLRKAMFSSASFKDISSNVTMTKTLKRLYVLMSACVDAKEPVLLVGNTGCGKTTVCQLLSCSNQVHLHILNCHQHTETADLIGGLRPVRNKDSAWLSMLKHAHDILSLSGAKKHPYRLEELSLTALIELCEESMSVIKAKSIDTKGAVFLSAQASFDAVKQQQQKYKSLFEWQDGPLVQAMREGNFILLDEISLAEDAVLERLNSVLEPGRTITLAEKGGNGADVVVGAETFRIFATMNPGGDFGKKELSPALRNRFTEIWVPDIEDEGDLLAIIDNQLVSFPQEIRNFGPPLLQFVKWFNTGAGDSSEHSVSARCLALTLRDILAWATFIGTATAKLKLDVWECYAHGASLVLLDGLGLGSGLSSDSLEGVNMRSHEYLLRQAPSNRYESLREQIFEHDCGGFVITHEEKKFVVGSFSIPLGPHSIADSQNKASYSLSAPTPSLNLHRLVRAMQLNKPILLEGSPGVGKTSLVATLAKHTGHRLVRINLSEQSDISDLLGSDLPVPTSEDKGGAQFSWCDGVFLQALKNGDWVLLDELNLAPQAVLEGLNACLDHRSTIYIPEIDQSFHCPPSFRVFAAQNPLQEGGGRKGLPKSFLNRFTKVHVKPLSSEDLVSITKTMYANLNKCDGLITKMIQFNTCVHEDIMVSRLYGKAGSPWEFNLRDVFRWCEAIAMRQEELWSPEQLVDLVYLQRLRTEEDRKCVMKRYKEIFGVDVSVARFPRHRTTTTTVQIGHSFLSRRDTPITSQPYPRGLGRILEHVSTCVSMNWPCLLVGPSGCGKSRVVRWLAGISGNPLREIVLSASTDATEILGCYEQADFSRWKQSFVSDFVAYVYNAVSTFVCLNISLAEVEVLNTHIWQLENGNYTSLSIIVDSSIQKLKALYEKHPEASSTLHGELPKFSSGSVRLQRYENAKQGKGLFEWVDGVFIQAMERGEWLILDNVNFCNAQVLDRLNPVLEPGGSLLINECGMKDGKPRIVNPHPNFRLFLCMNPVHGEISRAMRNRCLEIAFTGTPTEDDLFDLIRSAGIWTPETAQCLITIHDRAIIEGKFGNRPSTRDLETFSQNVSSQLMHGAKTFNALLQGSLQAYPHLKNPLDPRVVDIVSSNSISQYPGVFPIECLHTEGIDTVRYGYERDGSILLFHLSKFNSNSKCILKNYLPESKSLVYRMDAEVDMDDQTILQLAIYRFMKSATVGDWSERSRWLLEQLRCRIPLSPTMLKLLMKSIEETLYRVQQSRILDDIKYAINDVLLYFSNDMRNLTKLFPDNLPFLKNNIEFIEKVSVAIRRLPNRVDAATSWDRLQNLARLFDLFFVDCSQAFIRKDRLLKMKRNLGTTARTLRALLSIFEKIDDALAALFSCDPYVTETNYLEMKNLIEKRDSLIDYLFETHTNEKDLLSSESLWHVHRLHKLLIQINKGDLVSQLSSNPGKLWKISLSSVSSAYAMFVEHLGGVSGIDMLCKNRLWKHGGHPNVSLTEESYRAKRALYKADWKFQVGNAQSLHLMDLFQSSSGFTLHDEDLRRKILCELSTIEFDSVGNTGGALHDILTEHKRYASQAVETLQSHSFVDEGSNDAKQWILQTGETFFQQISQAWAKIQLWNVADTQCLVMEGKLINDLLMLQILVSSSPNKFAASRAKELLDSILLETRSFLHTSLTSSSFPLSKLSVYQHLLRKFSERPDQSTGILQQIKALLAPTLPVILSGYHTSLWNPVCIHSGCARWISQPLIYDIKEHHSINEAVDSNVTKGCNRFTSSLLNEIMVENSCDTDERLALIDIDGKIHRLKLLLEQAEKSTPYDESVDHQTHWKLFLLTIAFCSKNRTIQHRLLAWETYSEPAAFDIVGFVNSSNDERLKQKGAKLIELYLDAVKQSFNDQISHAEAWVYLGLLRLCLLLPSSPLDPCAKPSMKKQANYKIIEARKSMLYVKECHERVWSGGISTSDPELLVETRVICHLEEQNAELGKHIVFRPLEADQFSRLYRDIHTASRTMFNIEKILDIMNSVRYGAVVQKKMIEKTWQSSSSRFISYVQQEYSGYEDIVTPVITSMYHVKHGIRMLLSIGGDLGAHNDRDTSLLNTMLCLPSQSSTPLDINDVLLVRNEYKVNALHATLHRLRLNLLARGQRFRRTDAEALDMVFNAYISVWHKARLEREKKQQADSSMFKFKDEATDDTMVNEAEFKSFFPQLPDDDIGKDEVSPPGDAKETPPLDLSVDDLGVIWATYCKAYNTGTNRHTEMAEEREFAFQLSGRVARLAARHADVSLLPAKVHLVTMCNVSCESNKLSTHITKDSSVSSSFQSFHWGTNVKEAKTAIPAIQALLRRTKTLVEAWPGNHVLLDIISCADRVLRMKASCSMFHMLSAVENLTRVCQLWEQVASKELRLEKEISTLSKLIVKWRKFEVDCWPDLLAYQESCIEKAALKWWPHLYSLMSSKSNDFSDSDFDLTSLDQWLSFAPSSGELIPSPWKNLYDALDSFIRTSSLGEFKIRLKMLKQFGEQSLLESKVGYQTEKVRVGRFLLHLYQFHSQHCVLVENVIARLRMPIEKKLNDHVKLSAWDEKTYYSLRESSEKSHRKLFQLVKEYKTILSAPVATYIDESVNSNAGAGGHDDLGDLNPETSRYQRVLAGLSESPPIQETSVSAQLTKRFFKSRYFLIISKYTNRAKELASKIDLENSSKIPENYTNNIIIKSKALAVGSKGITKVTKKRALVGLLKSLKENGVQNGLAKIPKEAMDPTFLFELSLPTKWLLAVRAFESANSYFYRNLLQLQRFRLFATASAPHPDVSSLELKLMHGFTENMHTKILKQRRNIIRASYNISLIENCLQLMKRSCSCDFISSGKNSVVVVTITQYCRDAKNKTDELVFVLQNVKHASCNSVLIEVLKDLQAMSNALGVLIDGFENAALEIYPETTPSTPCIVLGKQSKLNQLMAGVLGVNSDLTAVIVKSARSGHLVTSHLKQASKSLELAVNLTSTFGPDKFTIDSDDLSVPIKAYDSLVEKCLFGIQHLTKWGALLEKEDLDSAHVLASNQLSALNIAEVANYSKDFLSSLSLAMKPLVVRLIPIISEYLHIFSRVLLQCVDIHRGFSKLLYVLLRVFRTTSAKGFCMPSEDQDSGLDGGEDDGEGEGTGMAEGTGAKDVSEEIEDEEQILGLQGDEQQEQPQDENRSMKKDDGVEMTTDFDGELQDIDDDNEEENEDCDEEEEVDREMGDIDEDDENVVDEKMWNDDEDDEGSEKEDKFEKDAEMEDDGNDEMRTKDDEDGNAEKASSDQEEQPKKSKPEEEEDEDKDKNKLTEDEDKVNEDEVEESHGIPLHEKIEDIKNDDENFEMPEAMDVDDEDSSEGGDTDREEKPEDPGEDNAETIDESENEEDGTDDDNDMGASPMVEDDLGEDDLGEDDARDEESADTIKPLNNDDQAQTQNDAVLGTEGSGAGHADEENGVMKDESVEHDSERVDLPANDESQNPDDPRSKPKGSKASSRSDGQGNHDSDEWKPSNTSRDPDRGSKVEKDSRNIPKPERTPEHGSVDQEWHRRLDVVDTENETAAYENSEPNNAAHGEAYEFTEGFENEQAKQTLAPTEQSQDVVSKDMEVEEQGRKYESTDAVKTDDTNDDMTDGLQEVVDPNLSAYVSEGDDHSDPLQRESQIVDSESLFVFDKFDNDDEEGEEVDDEDNDVDVNDGSDIDIEEDMLQAGVAPVPGSSVDGHEMYSRITAKTAEASSRLCEQLRLLLEPTLATKLCGDFRTGKRINMRKIIPYIASSFKKDKIWLRRKKPSKREYQIVLAIDDSNSMASLHEDKPSPGQVACDALVTLANAMTRLEVGELAVASYGRETKFLHDLGTPFTADSAANVLEQFSFTQSSSPMTKCVKKIYQTFLNAKRAHGPSNVDHWQIAFIVTDAIFDDDARANVPMWIRRATEQRQLIVMIMIDKESEGTRAGVRSVKRVKYVKGKPTLVHYLEDYPFPYYVMVRDVESIPEVLTDALRQWFQMLNQDD